MMIAREDLPLIRAALLTLAATALAVAGAVWGSAHLEDRMRQGRDEAQQRLDDARTRLRQASQEGRDIRRYRARYETLLERGLIGEERRLDWIDAVGRVKDRRKLFEIDYEISAQQPVAAEGLMPQGELDLRSSRMKVDLPLLHEGDLLNFLDDLAARDKGLFVIQGCEILRGDGATGLRASCSLDWLTLRPAGGGEARP
jgi:hypothetical protein